MMYKHKCLACDRKEFKSQKSYTQHALWGHFSKVTYDEKNKPLRLTPSQNARDAMAKRGKVRSDNRRARARKASGSRRPSSRRRGSTAAASPRNKPMEASLPLEEENARLRAIATFLFNQCVLRV